MPAKLRRLEGIEPGQEFQLERVGRGEFRLIRRLTLLNGGVIEWLLACPEKDFFVRIDSRPTDVL